MYRFLTAAALALCCSLAGASPTPTQLPRNVRPLHYDLALTPDASAYRFSAKASIEIEVLSTSRRITLNAAGLAFTSVRIRDTAGRSVPAKRIKISEEEQTASFDFAKPLRKGRYHLELDYSGEIGKQAIGLFALDYDSAQGPQRALYTQFENSDARRMLPSWDEPAYKASFSLQATIPAAHMAVSNMPVSARTLLPDGRARVEFARSPRMSTYLLFFGLGDFERATTSIDGTEIGVITKQGGAAQAAFVLEASKSLLREYNDYFGMPYPLPKLDNIAAPGRNSFFGAMENWGAIFTFEHAMLLEPGISTAADKQEVFSTAAHEIAHQWFGNLVTMRWWDDIWLNEGFATWMESRMTARLHPEWNSVMGAIAAREEAMGQDALASAHPVVQKISTVEQANQAFDSITYRKGEAVIRMLEAYVGETAWRDGVRAYLKAHVYQNTVSDDLWASIDKLAAKPVSAIAHDFTLQAGVPMIEVNEARCVDGATQVRLSQTEFSRDRPPSAPRTWRVPVVAQVAGYAPVHNLVSGGKAAFTVPGCGPLVLNAGQTGYYRSLYPASLMAQLTAHFSTLAPLDQLGLMADSWALGLNGNQSMDIFLELAKATPVKADPQVLGKLAESFAALAKHYESVPARRAAFAGFAIKRLAPLLQHIGWDAQANEHDSVANLREALIQILGDLGDELTITQARLLYQAALKSQGSMPASLRSAVLGVVAQHADSAVWEQLLASARQEKTSLLKTQYYDLLASANDPLLARRALDLALSGEPGATTSASLISIVAAKHPELAFDFAASHMQQVDTLTDASSRSRFYPMLAAASADPAMPGKLRAFAANHFALAARADTEQAAQIIEARIKLRAARLPAVDQWLAKQTP